MEPLLTCTRHHWQHGRTWKSLCKTYGLTLEEITPPRMNAEGQPVERLDVCCWKAVTRSDVVVYHFDCTDYEYVYAGFEIAKCAWHNIHTFQIVRVCGVQACDLYHPNEQLRKAWAKVTCMMLVPGCEGIGLLTTGLEHVGTMRWVEPANLIPCTGCRFVIFVTFLRVFDISLLNKQKKLHTVWRKPRNVTKFRRETLWQLDMSHFFKSSAQSYVYLLCLDWAGTTLNLKAGIEKTWNPEPRTWQVLKLLVVPSRT